MTPRLYGYWRSSATWRVRIGLNLKGIAYDYVPMHLIKDGGQHRKAEHLARNPMAQVPVLELEVGGEVRCLSQSMAILEYVEEAWPEPRLLPVDLWQRARTRMFAELVNSGIQPLQNLYVNQKLSADHGTDPAVWNAHFIGRGLKALEASAAEGPGPFLSGDKPGLAECFLIPQLFNARRFQVDLSECPTLTTIEHWCNELPAFQAAHPDVQPDAGL